MSDLVGNPEDRFSHVASHIFLEHHKAFQEIKTLCRTIMFELLCDKVNKLGMGLRSQGFKNPKTNQIQHII